MVRTPTRPKPGSGQISKSVLGGLVMGNFFSATFEPSIAIGAKRIDKLGVDIRSFREPLLRAIREVMVPSIDRNFNEGGRPAWEPLSETTWDIRSRFGWEGGRALVLSGALQRVAGQINIWTITQDAAAIRDLPDSVWYGKVHQEGYGGKGGGGSMKAAVARNDGDVGAALKEIVAKARSGGSRGRGAVAIPARPFFVIQPEDQDDIQDIFMEWLEERVNRAWP